MRYTDSYYITYYIACIATPMWMTYFHIMALYSVLCVLLIDDTSVATSITAEIPTKFCSVTTKTSK